MTIGNNGVRVSYAGNGATTAFAVPFAFFTPDEIEVWSLTAGVFTRMTRGTHYSVAGGLGGTGTITAVAAPAIGTSWSFRRATRRTQAVNYTDNDPFDGNTTEGALDRGVALVQELAIKVFVDTESDLRLISHYQCTAYGSGRTDYVTKVSTSKVRCGTSDRGT
jgi:hypothetical protein